MKSLALLVLLVALATAQRQRYDGHKVIRVHGGQAPQQLDKLRNLRAGGILNLDFWSSVNVDGDVDIHVKPENEARFLAIVEAFGFSYDVTVPDLQALVDEEEASNIAAEEASPYSVVGRFAKHSEINSWLDSMAASSSIASIVKLGTSYEGRTMNILKISSGGTKQAIFLDAGIHAREWLAPATATWMVNEILTKYGSDSGITAMVDKYDWYVIPVLNPDGYEYTFTGDRMWRKTRQPHGSFCRGADPNRNFDYPVFGGEGTSSQPCSDIYKGPVAYSEPEAAALRDFLTEHASSFSFYISLHTYGQYWLTPWAYARVRPTDAAEMDRVANIGADAVKKVHGKSFTVGPAPYVLYAAAGGSDDWAKGGAGIKYAYTLELRPKTNGNGFIVNTSEITPSGEETLAGLQAMLNAVE